MISVSNVTMRYGSKLLFEDVSVTFTTGRRYGLTGPNGAGKSTFMKVLTGEIDAQKGTVVRPQKIGVLKQDQYEFDAYRVIDTVIMGNAALWAALEERELIYAKPEMTDEDGSRLGELEGIVGDEDGYEAESNAAVLLQGLDIPDELHERKMPSCRAARRSASCSPRPSSATPGAAARRAHQLPRPRVHPLARKLPQPLRRHGHHHLPRPPLPQLRLHPHRRHRLRDHHHLYRRLRRHGPAEDPGPRPHREPERAAREEDRPAQRLHRPLLGRHPQLAGQLAQERSRATRHHRARPLQHPAPLHQLQEERPSGKHVLEVEGVNKSYAQPTARPSTSSATSPPPSCAATRSSSSAATARARPPSSRRCSPTPA